MLGHWTQTGLRKGSPGKIRFESDSGLLVFTITLENRDGLYYCPLDVFTVDEDAPRQQLRLVYRAKTDPLPVRQRHGSYEPVSLNHLTESELWRLRLGSLGEDQLDLLPENATGIPKKFHYHPFRYIDWKEEARVQRQKAQKYAERTDEPRK